MYPENKLRGVQISLQSKDQCFRVVGAGSLRPFVDRSVIISEYLREV